MENSNIFYLTLAIILIIFILITFKNRISYYTGAYFKSTHRRYGATINHAGNLGEYIIFKKLEKIKGARLLSSVYVKKRSGEYTEIDVLMVLESGIYVIESKNYKGAISGFMTAKNWTQSIGRKKNTFYNPILQNEAHLKALKYFLGFEDFSNLHSVICFSDKCNLDNVHLDTEDIIITKPRFLLRDLKKSLKENKHTFTKKEADEIYEKLKKWEHPNRKVVKSQLHHAKERAKIERKKERIERLKFWKRKKRYY